MTMEILDTIAGSLLLGGAFVLFTYMNYRILFLKLKKAEYIPSPVPFIGGVAGTFLVYCLCGVKYPILLVLPLLIDPGSIPLLIWFIICMINITNKEKEKVMSIFTSEKKLGFGLMRLPLVPGGAETEIDVEHVKKMVDHFMERGFTYFDTAWMYHGFQSEKAIKKALVERYPRDSYTLTTKFHVGFCESKDKMEDFFRTQLANTGVEYFDYYLIHDIERGNYAKYQAYDAFNWALKKKEMGLIKHLGFSFHSDADFLDQVLTEHPYMEFVQLQINYLDWESANVQSRRCYEVARKHNCPIIVMEPVKGGTLVNVPENVQSMFKSHEPNLSIPSWAIRFCASLPGIEMVLSGMSNMDQMKDNVSYMKDFKPLTESEINLCITAGKMISGDIKIPCTGCSYCTEGCPLKIAIPKLFALYNQDGTDYAMAVGEGSPASKCVGCGQCEGICPQHLEVISYLKDVAAKYEV